MARVTLLDKYGNLVNKWDIDINPDSSPVIQLGNKYYIYTHDSLVGTPKVREHYYKEVTVHKLKAPTTTTKTRSVKDNDETKVGSDD